MKSCGTNHRAAGGSTYRLNAFRYQPDGYHPGGGILDEENGVQHIFVYAGTQATPTGIYRITRTIDTDKLRKAMSSR